MRISRLILLPGFLALAFPAIAALTPATIVPGGKSQPLIGDVNGDGLTDIVQDRMVFLNLGGTFIERDLGIRAPQPTEWNGGDSVIALLDINGDGRADLLTRDRPSAPIRLEAKAQQFRIYVAGAALPYRDAPIELGSGIDPFVADANDDGRDDLVFIKGVAGVDRYADANDVTVMLSNGDGTFTARPTFRIAANLRQLFGERRLLSGDIDRDGHGDLLIPTQYDLVLLRGRGNGDFAPPENHFAPLGSFNPALVDVDGDGNLDFVTEEFRGVRVLFGDGRGHFPRHSTVSAPRVREVPHPAEREMQYQGGNVRGMAIGEWVRQGRVEIAIGTPEGDAVILAYQNGRMAEVGRVATEYMAAEMYAGSFLEVGKRDLYLVWSFGLPADRPEPRVFDAQPVPVPTSAPAGVSGGRMRSARGFVAPTLEFDVTVTGDCAPAGVQRWSLAREGIFGFEERDGYKVETMLAYAGRLDFRLTVPWSGIPIIGWLDYSTFRSTAGTWIGTAAARTACGSGVVRFSAVQR
jgi:hypothetical protein